VTVAFRSLVLLTSLAACTAAPDAVDGIYVGHAERAAANVPPCTDTGPGSFEVGDATLVYAPDATSTFFVPVPLAGPLHATAGAATLDGRRSAGRMEFTVSKPGCQVRYRLSRAQGF
jgi:hypothetical protein